MNKGKEILLGYGERIRLMSAFHISYPTIRKALRFETDTKLARKIRHIAISEYGGIERAN